MYSSMWVVALLHVNATVRPSAFVINAIKSTIARRILSAEKYARAQTTGVDKKPGNDISDPGGAAAVPTKGTLPDHTMRAVAVTR